MSGSVEAACDLVVTVANLLVELEGMLSANEFQLLGLALGKSLVFTDTPDITQSWVDVLRNSGEGCQTVLSSLISQVITPYMLLVFESCGGKVDVALKNSYFTALIETLSVFYTGRTLQRAESFKGLEYIIFEVFMYRPKDPAVLLCLALMVISPEISEEMISFGLSTFLIQGIESMVHATIDESTSSLLYMFTSILTSLARSAVVFSQCMKSRLDRIFIYPYITALVDGTSTRDNNRNMWDIGIIDSCFSLLAQLVHHSDDLCLESVDRHHMLDFAITLLKEAPSCHLTCARAALSYISACLPSQNVDVMSKHLEYLCDPVIFYYFRPLTNALILDGAAMWQLIVVGHCHLCIQIAWCTYTAITV